jgi:hypothetical protein
MKITVRVEKRHIEGGSPFFGLHPFARAAAEACAPHREVIGDYAKVWCDRVWIEFVGANHSVARVALPQFERGERDPLRLYNAHERYRQTGEMEPLEFEIDLGLLWRQR